MAQNLYDSVQRSELQGIYLMFLDFPEPLSIVTNSNVAESVCLHIENTELISDDSKLTLLFIQLQLVIRNRSHLLYMIHIRSHTSLPHPLAQVMMKLTIF